MDKSVAKDKRQQDRRHKKPHTGKAKQKGTSTKSGSAPPTIPFSDSYEDDQFSRRPIEPNWNRSRDLSTDESDSDDGQLRAADFEKLLQAHPSSGNHFLLSSEKQWAKEAEEYSQEASQKYGQYFRIDTKLLNASLATIPLFERNGYSRELFTKREIDSMVLKAEYESTKYKDLCSKLEKKKKMSDNSPAPPVKCLIGEAALPSEAASQQNRSNVQQPTVRPPVPCLIGPAALPKDIRVDRAEGRPAVLAFDGSVEQRLSNVHIGINAGDVVPTDDVVPIESNEPNVSGILEQPNKAPKETTEEIQQWLDDILDM